MPDAQVHGPGEQGCVVNALGRTLWFDPSDERGAALAARSGDLNAGSLRLWSALVDVRAWDVVLDVGTNYGEMLLGVDLSAVATVVGFEPNPRILPHLLRSIDEAGVGIPIRQLAVSAHDGETLVFAIDTEWSGMSGIAASRRDGASHRVEEIEVVATTIDAQLDAMAGDGAVLVKVDVEGAEDAVLAGAAGLLASDRPWAMMLEVLHMSVAEQVDLLARHDVVALDLGAGDLARVPAMSADAWSALLATGWVYPQDLAIVGRGMVDGVPSIVDRVAAREALLAASARDADSVEDRARELGAATASADAQRVEADALRAERDLLRAERDALLSSRSWRITRPVRAITSILRRR